MNDPFSKTMYYTYLTPTGRSLRVYTSKSLSQQLQELRLLKQGLAELKELK